MKRFVALPLLLAVTSASAAWFTDDGSYSRRREEKVSVLSPARGEALEKLVAERNARATEVEVLARLEAEKTGLVEAADKRLAGEYGIRTDRNYNYDPSSLTIYFLSTDERHGGSPDAPARLAHRVFPDETEAEAFLALVSEKQAALDARTVFHAARAEKETALRDVTARLGREFSLDPARSYRYDADLRAIFAQFVPPPPPRVKTPEEIAAEKDAKAAAERAARQAAVARAEELRAEAKRIAEEKEKLAVDQTESRKLRDEAMRRVEKELAELDAKEAKLRKAEEERKAEQERIEKRAAEKAAAEKAKAEERAKREAEKAAAEKAKEDAIRAEEDAVARRVAAEKETRTAALVAARRKASNAQLSEQSAEQKLESVRKRLAAARKEGLLPPARMEILKTNVEMAEDALSNARRARKEADSAAEEAEEALDRAERDATRAFDDELRAAGGKPVRPDATGGGFFSWF